jgi:signal transduction histidine kinase
VLANPAQIQQVVMSLITNASEAMGEGAGVITIATSEAHVEDGLSPDILNLRKRGRVRLEVSDTGCGMTEETRSKIFDPFFTTKSAGRGLGLAECMGLSGVTAGLSTSQARPAMFPIGDFDGPRR